MNRKRSVGIVVFAGLEIFSGVIWILQIFYLMQLEVYPNEHIRSLALQAKAPLGYHLITILYLFILGVLTLKLYNAARILNIFLSPITALFIVLSINCWLIILGAYVGFLRILRIILPIIPTIIGITAAIIFYFTRPRVKAQFKAEGKTE